MLYGQYEGADPECITEEVSKVVGIIDELKDQYRDAEPTQPNLPSGIVVQSFDHPNLSIAKKMALPYLGYDVVTNFTVGGSNERTVLWANTSGTPEHAQLARHMAVAVWEHPLYDMINKATFGALADFQISKDGISSKKYSTEGMSGELLPRAFMLSEVVGRIRNYGRYIRAADYFILLHNADIRPLGFEEVAGIGMMIVRDTLKEHPELGPS